jgi:hypothetical protein
MLPQEVAAGGCLGGCRQLGWWEGLGPASTTQLPAHLNSVTHAHTHAYPRTHAARREMDGDSSGGVDFAEFQAWFERLKAAGAMPSWGAVRPAPLSSAVLLLLHPHLLRVDSLLALWISHCALCGSFSCTRADAVARRFLLGWVQGLARLQARVREEREQAQKEALAQELAKGDQSMRQVQAQFEEVTRKRRQAEEDATLAQRTVAGARAEIASVRRRRR